MDNGRSLGLRDGSIPSPVGVCLLTQFVLQFGQDFVPFGGPDVLASGAILIFFDDFPPFAFQIQRLIAECPAGGGEVTEVSRAVGRMRAGDFDELAGRMDVARRPRPRAGRLGGHRGPDDLRPRGVLPCGQLLPIGRVLPPPRPPRQAADLGSNDSVLRQGRSVLGSSVRGARPALSRRCHPARLPRSPGQGGRAPTNGALSQRRRRNEGGVLVPRRQELRRSRGQLRGVRRAGPGRTTSQTESALSSGLRGSGRTGGGSTRSPR